MIQIEARLDTHAIELGGQVNLTLSVQKSLGPAVIFPAFGDTLFGIVEIVRKSDIDSIISAKNQVILKQVLTLTAFDTGLFYLPPVNFVLRTGSYTDTLSSSANYLEVLPFPIDTTQTIRDIKGLYKAPVTLMEVIPWVLLAIVMIGLSWFLVYYVRKRRRNEPIIARSVPLDPPDVIALRELDRLKTEKLWQQGKIKEYYSRLSEIIRGYIEGRYGIMALEQTSFDILAAMQENLANGNLYAELKSLLQLSDLVKFAKADPDPDENVSKFEMAWQFVLNTRNPIPAGDIVENPDQQTAIVKTEI
jgi:hypothetical protein